jgi:hypothetical protein
MCIYHIFFIHSSVEGHLGWFHSLVIINIATINMGLEVSLLYSDLLEKIFSNSVDCLFSLVTVFLCLQKFYSLMQFHLLILAFVAKLLESYSGSSCQCLCLLEFSVCFPAVDSKFRSHIKVFDPLWIDFTTIQKTGI